MFDEDFQPSNQFSMGGNKIAVGLLKMCIEEDYRG